MWVWDLGGQAVGDSLLGSGFYQDPGAGLGVCFDLKCAFFVFVTAARGCCGPSNLYHVLIIPAMGRVLWGLAVGKGASPDG